jgi:glycosyltransferase involved in cell wall biosynthesis
MLPYYGDIQLMKQAVGSVLRQTFTDFALTVVDDNYPDPEPARWFGTLADARVRYLRNDVGLGANGNYRRCLELASAPVVLIMGADDVMLPDHLQVVTDVFAAHPEATVVHTGVEVIDENDNTVRPLGDRVKGFYAPSGPGTTVLAGEALAVSLLRGNWTYFPSLAWRTAFIQQIGFRGGLDVVQDLALLLDVATAGGSLVFDPRLTFNYRRHSAQDSTVRALDGRRFDEEREFFLREAASFDRLGWTNAARVARWHVSSRLNALTLLPRAVRATGWSGFKRLGRHVVG